MNRRGIAALLASLLLFPAFANVSAKKDKDTVHITVLDSETRSLVLDNSGVPKNCDGVNYDAYCHSSSTTRVTNMLLVQEDDGSVFRVACTMDSKWSRCIRLPKGESFDAKREKHGITIYYRDDDDKLRRQLYVLLATQESSAPTGGSVAASPAVTPPQNAMPPADRPAVGPRETVKCTFNSTPPGAEITLDGQYVGSTPSTLPLSTGTHVVVISIPAFTAWKRELAVTAGSVLTVSALLHRAQ